MITINHHRRAGRSLLVVLIGGLLTVASTNPGWAGTATVVSKLGMNFSPFAGMPAGSASFPMLRTNEQRSGLGASWDGRLIFTWSSNQDANGNVTDSAGNYYHNSGWVVSTFSPEKLALKANGLPTLDDPALGSGFTPGSGQVAFATDSLNYDACDYAHQDFSRPPATATQADGRSHLTVFPDPAYAENPYPSDLKGNPVGSSAGIYTYRIIVVGNVSRVWVPGVGSVSTCGIPQANPGGGAALFVRSTARITVTGYKTTQPLIASTEISPSVPLTTAVPIPGSGESYFRGEEPSFSQDGRIMVWQISHWPYAQHGGELLAYSFNPTPGAATGWSAPQSMSDMYYINGPGNPQGETRVGPDGIPFSQLYPIAAHPFRLPDGTVLQKGSFVKGAYPWLSFDASELFAGAINGFRGTARHGNYAIGKLTNWTYQNLDGPINTTRGNVRDTPDYYPDPNATASSDPKRYEAQQMMDAYDALHGYEGWETILLTPLGLSGSMWGGINHTLNSPLPIHPGKRVYSFILSHSARYVEVPLGDAEDGEYLVRYSMNEMTRFNQLVIDQYGSGNRNPYRVPLDPAQAFDSGDFPDYREKGITFDPTHTPDTSGNFVTGTLVGGAQFPFEYNRAKQVWNDSRQLLDKFEGVWGNAIYFPGGSSVQATLPASQTSRILANQALSASLWVKPLANLPTGATHLLSLGGVFGLSYRSGTGFEVTFAGKTAPTLVAIAALPTWQWSHVAVTYGVTGLQIYLNGNPIAALANPSGGLLGGVSPANASFVVGPDNATGSADALLMIDEVSLSDVERSFAETQAQALIRQVPSSRQTTAQLVPGVEASRAIALVPAENPMSADKVALGKALFSDTLLSGNQQTSCATCHGSTRGFTDGLALRSGLSRNAPTLVDRLFSGAQFWDGHAASLEDQALAPIQNPLEMNADLNTVVGRLTASATYPALFKKAFNDVPSARNLALAISAYERSLRSAPSPYDLESLSPEAQAGRGLFFGKARCVACHSGSNFTDEQFRNNGLAPIGNTPDLGLAAISGRPADLFRFKTPTLRHLGLTGPFMHDGRFGDLTAVVEHYNRGGDFAAQGLEPSLEIKPLNLTPTEVNDLVAFLGSLDSAVTEGGLPTLTNTPAPVVIPSSVAISLAVSASGTTPVLGGTPSFSAGASITYSVVGPPSSAFFLTGEHLAALAGGDTEPNLVWAGSTDASGRWTGPSQSLSLAGTWNTRVAFGPRTAAAAFNVTGSLPAPPAPQIGLARFSSNVGGNTYVEIYGSNFGASGNSVQVTCGGAAVPSTISYQSVGQINVFFPVAFVSRTCTAVVTYKRQSSTPSGSISIPAVPRPPAILGVAYAGSSGGNAYLAIYGTDFGSSGNLVTVVCDGAAVTSAISYQSASQINVSFPVAPAARSCAATVAYNGLSSASSPSASVPGTVVVPAIVDFTYSGVSGDQSYATAFGNGFGNSGNVPQMTCNGQAVATTVWSEYPGQVNFHFAASPAARTCTVTITAHGLTSAPSAPLTVPAGIAAPTITNVNFGGAGGGNSWFNIYGNGFAASGNQVLLTCGGVTVANTVPSEASTQVNFFTPVSNTARSCTVVVTSNGVSSAPSGAFTIPAYVTPPVITKVINRGVSSKKVTIELDGTGFGSSGNTVQFTCGGTTPAIALQSQSTTVIKFTLAQSSSKRTCSAVVTTNGQSSAPSSSITF